MLFRMIFKRMHPYISKEATFKGYLFASSVSLYMHYKVLNLLNSAGINDRISVSDLLFELSNVMAYERNGNLLEIPKKDLQDDRYM